jgi:hypothetical protein
LYKHNHPVTPSQVENIVDLGYLGIQKDFPTVKSVLPVKKKKNALLSSDEIIYNKNQSRLKIIVEHTICKIKKFGIMGNQFRNSLKRYNNASDIVFGLVNLRVMQSNRISL